MSKSEENTNELESYGVWVKNTPNKEPSQNTDQEDTLDLGSDDMELDLPDFDDTDISDIFNDNSGFTADGQDDDFGSDLDTTLSTDELAKITEDVDTTDSTEEISEPIFDEQPEVISEEEVTSFEPDSIEDSDLDISDMFETPIEDTVNTDDSNTNLDENLSISDNADFNIDDMLDEATNIATESSATEKEPKNASEEVSDDVSLDEMDFNAGDEEEISLDDFMDEGFSDESVASGNNGYEPGAEKQEPTVESSEEISLDDFLDEDSFASITDNNKNDEEVDEKPIKMDITFDDSVDSVETEENISLDNSSDDYEETEDSIEEEFVTEDLTPIAVEEKEERPVAETESFDTEEIDLSDFGIDEAAEETPIVQDVETQKNKEKVVDYDLFIGNENTSSAPVVNEIKDDNQIEEIEEVEDVEATPSNSTAVDNSLLQQIVADLSSLKNEINNLKTNIEEIKSNEEKLQANQASVCSESNNLGDLNIPAEEEKDEGGFFSSDDTDVTIALSGDELDNIMNNADFSEIEEENNIADNDIADSNEAVAKESEEPKVIEEDIFDNSTEETAIDEDLSFEEMVDSIENEESTDSDSESVETTENTVPTTEITEEFDIDSLKDEDIFTEDTDETVDENLNFQYEDEKLEEPNFDDISIDSPEEEEEDIPEEISIPKDEDIFVESTSSDFMDSVQDSTDALTPPIENDVEEVETVEEITDDDSFDADEVPSIDDLLNEDETDSTEEIVDPIEKEEDVPTVDKLLNQSEEDNDESSFDDVDFLNNEEDKADEFTPSITDEETDFLTSDLSNEEDQLKDNDSIENVNSETVTSDETIEEPMTDDISSKSEDITKSDDIGDLDLPDFEDDVIEEQDEPTSEETAIDNDIETNESFEEVDNLNSDLSNSNIDYLTKNDETTTKVQETLNGDLKQEIKSVLLYMDQLLENLPEDKIYEFAKSDEFATYKKLFKDLGLS